jgi:radical SAM protein with 4Fe4S-binding SPASM domain
MINLALDLGVTIFSVTEFLPCGRGKNIAHLALSKDQRREMYQYLIERRRQPAPCIYILNDPYYFLSLEKEFQQRCFNPLAPEMVIGDLAGILYCGVKPNGKVMPHPGVRITIGDLREQELKQIWEDSEILKQLRDRKNLRGKCGRCEYKFVCGGSRAAAYQASKDMMAEDPRCWYEPLLGQ